MSRRRNPAVVVPTTFVGTFYDKAAGVYVATRKDGSITVGATNKRGVNLTVGAVFPNGDPSTVIEH